MSPVALRAWDGAAWAALHGGPPPGGGGETFVLGQTLPTALNSGFRVPEAGLVTVTGAVTAHPAGTTVEGRKFTGQLDLGSGDGPITYRDCLFTMEEPHVWPASDTQALTYNAVKAWGAHAGVRFEFCEFRPDPAFLSHNTYGPQGGAMEFYRCKFRDCVDFIVFQGFTGGGAARPLKVEGCFFDDPLFFQVDPRQGPEGTHSDGGQHVGNGAGIRWVGNRIEGGVTSCLLFGRNIDGGYSDVTVEQNWLLGHPTSGSTINFAADPDPVEFPITRITMKKNRVSTGGKTPGILVRNAVRNLTSTDLGLSSGGTGTPVAGQCNVQLDPATMLVIVDSAGVPVPYPVTNGG